ncbi:MAG: glycyl-radical enzyme activating protein [Deltaproteobacteria bacterium]|nr:glycyl-radical enzyme activating protein [Deltaproteobacteria bacterium]
MTKQKPGAPSNQGSIFLIQGYSTNDGPGIRTTVFTKGCPLKCLWCHNPESANPFPELMTHDDRCIACLKCLEACSQKAITFDPKKGRKIERRRCNLCLDCVKVCPSKSLTTVGEIMTVDQVMIEILKDELFFNRSGGGVTVSGGEPLSQGPFILELLKACKERGLHTALDTSGYGSWSVLENLLEYLDLVLFDIKHMDSRAHIQGTGKSNALPLSNLRRIPRNVNVWIRLPLIPGYNDSPENLDRLIALAREVGAEKISLLPFNRYGDGKYLNLGRKIPLPDLHPSGKEKIKEIKTILERSGLPVGIGE